MVVRTVAAKAYMSVVPLVDRTAAKMVELMVAWMVEKKVERKVAYLGPELAALWVVYLVDLTAQKMVDGKESQSDDMMVVSKDK